jgi:hypothetical protein
MLTGSHAFFERPRAPRIFLSAKTALQYFFDIPLVYSGISCYVLSMKGLFFHR